MIIIIIHINNKNLNKTLYYNYYYIINTSTANLEIKKIIIITTFTKIHKSNNPKQRLTTNDCSAKLMTKSRLKCQLV